MLPNKFKPGDVITAERLNALIDSIAKALRITATAPLKTTQTASGTNIALTGYGRQVIHGTIVKDLPYGKAGVMRVNHPTPQTGIELPPIADGNEDPVAGPSESAGDNPEFVWAINFALPSGKKLEAGTRVHCIREYGWWYIIACDVCPKTDEDA